VYSVKCIVRGGDVGVKEGGIDRIYRLDRNVRLRGRGVWGVWGVGEYVPLRDVLGSPLCTPPHRGRTTGHVTPIVYSV
jgi:hypothetical protein